MIKYFDDFVVGEKLQHGAYQITREEVLSFFRQYGRPTEVADDDERVRTSGCHTIAIFQRMRVDMGFADGSADAVMAAVGLDELRWLTPVYSGDVLKAECEVLEKIESRSKPDRGILKSRYTLHNQAGEVALTLISSFMMQRRPLA